MFMLSDVAIAALADKAEKAIGCYSNRNSPSDKNIIENAIRSALMAQAQQLITIIPTGASVLDLHK